MKKIVRIFDEDGTFQNQKELTGDKAIIELKPSYSEDEIIENAKGAHFIICGYEQITPRILDSLPNLEMVCFQSIGTNGIDIDEANKRNLPVSNISKYCVEEVSDYVAGCIISHNRRLVQFDQAVKVKGNWNYDEYPEMRRLKNETIGFLGFGNIPRMVVDKMKNFGCRVLAYDPFLDQETFTKYGVESASMEDIFKESDYISVHLPLNKNTASVLDSKLFDLATKSPALINSARGGVINEEDLVAALDNNTISSAYLDVLTSEYPVLAEEALIQHSKTIVTPHSAFYSTDSMEQAGSDVIKNILNFMDGNYNEVDIVNRRSIDLNEKGEN